LVFLDVILSILIFFKKLLFRNQIAIEYYGSWYQTKFVGTTKTKLPNKICRPTNLKQSQLSEIWPKKSQSGNSDLPLQAKSVHE